MLILGVVKYLFFFCTHNDKLLTFVVSNIIRATAHYVCFWSVIDLLALCKQRILRIFKMKSTINFTQTFVEFFVLLAIIRVFVVIFCRSIAMAIRCVQFVGFILSMYFPILPPETIQMVIMHAATNLTVSSFSSFNRT